jgi:hypothetical protein
MAMGRHAAGTVIGMTAMGTGVIHPFLLYYNITNVYGDGRKLPIK